MSSNPTIAAPSPSPLFASIFPIRSTEAIAADAPVFDQRVTTFFGGRSRSSSPLPPPPPHSPPATLPATPTTVATYPGPALTFISTRDSTTLPPPYLLDEFATLPAYREPDTLAQKLFFYGFFFPLFWALGATIIVSKLRASPEWEPEKAAEDREKRIAIFREAELKWARRCLWAFMTVLGIAISVICIFRFSIFGDRDTSATERIPSFMPPLIL